MKPTCEIRWVDDHGHPTPDTNPAVARCRMDAHDWTDSSTGRVIHFEASQWYWICQHHLDQLLHTRSIRALWTYEPIEQPCETQCLAGEKPETTAQ